MYVYYGKTLAMSERIGKTAMTSSIPVSIPAVGDTTPPPVAVMNSPGISQSKKLAARRTLRLAIPKLQQAESMQHQQLQQQQQQRQALQQQLSPTSNAYQSKKQQQNNEAITRLIQRERNFGGDGGGVSIGRVSHSDGSTCSSGASSADIGRNNTSSYPDSDGFLFKHRMQELSPSPGFGCNGKSDVIHFLQSISQTSTNNSYSLLLHL